MSARTVAAGLGLVVALGTLAGCGGGSSPPMTPDAARALAAADQGVHAALAAGNPAEVGAALAALRQEVSSLEHRGQLTAARATSILTATDAVAADVVLLPTTTTTTTTTPPVTRPEKDKHGPDHQGGG